MQNIVASTAAAVKAAMHATQAAMHAAQAAMHAAQVTVHAAQAAVKASATTAADLPRTRGTLTTLQADLATAGGRAAPASPPCRLTLDTRWSRSACVTACRWRWRRPWKAAAPPLPQP